MRLQVQAGFAFSALLIATISNAQTSQQPLSLRQRLQHPVSVQKPQAATPAPAPQQPLQQVAPPAASLLDQPAQPAHVTFTSGKLAIEANNSSLSGVLHEIATRTGMKLDAIPGDQRIFGSYGPAAPREVLSALLDGGGYNVLMVGALANGAPRELTLTQRSQASMPGAQPNAVVRPINNNSNNDDDNDDPAADQPPEQQPPPRPETNSPEPAQQQPPNAGQPGAVKSPQQILQELQQMHQQQLQGNPQ